MFKIMNLENLNQKYKFKVDGICHVGAWRGTESETYQKLFSDIPIMFIEANPNLNCFYDEKINKNILYKNIAAGSSKKVSKMFLHDVDNKTGQSSSLLKPKKHLLRYPSITFSTSIEVQVDTLDSITENFKFNYLAIDVQGYELEVLRGSENCLKNVDYIITEVNKDELYENCPHISDIDSFLKPFGFERKETEWYNNTEDWGDALYIKE